MSRRGPAGSTTALRTAKAPAPHMLEAFDRWLAGETIPDIAGRLNATPSAVRYWVDRVSAYRQDERNRRASGIR